MTDIERIAKQFHDAYERRAEDFGWDTQDRCKVEWEDLPEANRLTMMAVVQEVVGPILQEINSGKPQAPTSKE